MAFQDASNEDLLGRYGQLLVTDHQGRQDTARERIYVEIIKRMRPHGQPKTEDCEFGELSKGDEFLTDNEARHRVVEMRLNGSLGAVEVEGSYKDELWHPGTWYKVRKIIK